jgi:hypothetical protein
MSREFPKSLGEGLGERPTFKPGDRVVWTFSDIDFSGTVLEVEADGEFATVRLGNGKKLHAWVGDLRRVPFA